MVVAAAAAAEVDPHGAKVGVGPVREAVGASPAALGEVQVEVVTSHHRPGILDRVAIATSLVHHGTQALAPALVHTVIRQTQG